MRNAQSWHRSWRHMVSRCYSTSDVKYPRYGARGIRVCERWHDSGLFLQDMGQRPIGTTLDRIDNDGNYATAKNRVEAGLSAEDAVRMVRRRPGKPKLTEEQARALRSLSASGVPVKDLASQFELNRRTVRHVLAGDTYRELKPLVPRYLDAPVSRARGVVDGTGGGAR